MSAGKRNVLRWGQESPGHDEDKSRAATIWFFHPRTVAKHVMKMVYILFYIIYSFGFSIFLDSGERMQYYHCTGESMYEPDDAKAYALFDDIVLGALCSIVFAYYVWYISQPHCKSDDEHAACSRVNARSEKAMDKMLKNLWDGFKLSWNVFLGNIVYAFITIAFHMFKMHETMYTMSEQETHVQFAVSANIYFSVTFLFFKTVMLSMISAPSGWPLVFKVASNCIITYVLWYIANQSGVDTIKVAGGHWFVYCFCFDNFVNCLLFQLQQDTRYANSNDLRIKEGLHEMYKATMRSRVQDICPNNTLCRKDLKIGGRALHFFLNVMFFLCFQCVLVRLAPREFDPIECKHNLPLILGGVGLGYKPMVVTKNVAQLVASGVSWVLSPFVSL